ncbi:MAG TPA: DEAD/DEAH box helicase [Patescibacteria group bacterium]|nr:DEAD/DEAH box helicase [Patescibacteria group bacterium]
MLKKNFSDFDLSPEMNKAVSEMGFEEATPIQSLAIGPILAGADIIGQAQTGTGKTAAFGIPILDRIDSAQKKVQALILCPTRELAVQIAEELKLLGKYKKDLRILPVYGGQPIERQIAALQRGVQVVVGTPGRVRDHMERKTLKLDPVRTVVLDEADEMLDMGFIDEMKFILGATPAGHQTLLFSATMPKAILSLSKAFQNQPEMVRVVHEDLTVPGVEQNYFEVKEFQKTEILARLIDIHDLKRALIFCNTKIRVDELVEKLQARGYAASGLHGDMKQVLRDRVMNQFRNGRLEILVATDVAARGLDIDDIEVVVNYDVPRDEEYYVHRIGRTARAGKSGRAFTFVAGREMGKLAEIQKFAKTRIRRQRLPSVDDVEEIRSGTVLEKIRQIMETETSGKYTALVEKLIGDDHSSLDVAAALLKMTMEKDGKGANVAVTVEPVFHFSAEDMTRLMIKLGRNQRIRPGDIVGAITGETDLPGRMIGAIDVHDRFSFVDVPQTFAASVIEVMNRCQIKGHPVFIKPAKGKGGKKWDQVVQ